MTARKSPSFGLYRRQQKNPRTGRWEDVGAYVLDMRIPKALLNQFAGLKPRIMRSTEVLPGTRNAATIVRDMKLMVKDLIRERDVDTLKRIQKDKLSLASAFSKWKTGRLHLAEQYEDKPVVKAWLQYLDKAVLADKTRKNRKAIVAALVSNSLLSEKDVLADLPDRLEGMREHYQRNEQHSAFNMYRTELLSFLTKGLGFDDESRLLRAVGRVLPLKQQKRRPHHPFESPRELEEFCRLLERRPSAQSKIYAESVFFMCFHGLRPEEFAGKRFRIDPRTGHLKIDGTKNENADRVVPLMLPIPDFKPPKVDTLNRTFERMKVERRCRDFRRTYAVWCEKAGFMASRIRAYMGHGDSSVTHTYQRVLLKREVLDADAEVLNAWVAAEMRRQASTPKERKLTSRFRLQVGSKTLTPAELLRRITEQEEADRKFEPARSN